MKYLHTMVRVTDIDASLRFYCDALGLKELVAQGLPAGALHAGVPRRPRAMRARRWSSPTTGIRRSYGGGRNFGHLAYEVDDIYATCQRLAEHGVTILRPPRDGHMAFVRSPDNISIELLQKGGALAAGRAVEVDAQHRHLVAPPRHAMKSIPSLLIAAVFATLTFAVWAYLNRPTREPPWPALIQGFAFSPFRADEDPTPRADAHRCGDRRGPGAARRARCKAVRTYSVEATLAQIPELAEQHDMNVAARRLDR